MPRNVTEIGITIGITIALFVSGALAQTVYQGRDAAGNPSYSDKPRPGDKPVELPPVNTTPAGPTLPAAAPPSEQFAGYTATLSAPGSVPNPAVPVEVQIAIEPALRDGDLWRLSIDGAFVAAGREAGYTFEGLDRGRHTLTLEITDPSGGVLVTAQPVDVFVQFSKANDGGRPDRVRPAPN